MANQSAVAWVERSDTRGSWSVHDLYAHEAATTKQKRTSARYLWERAMPAIFRAHGALPQWICERPLRVTWLPESTNLD